MNVELKSKGKRMLYGLALLLVLLTAITPIAAQAVDDLSVNITVKQVFTSNSATADGNFTYNLKALTANSPLPAGSGAEGYFFTVSGSGTVDAGPLIYKQPGVYRYELSPVIAVEKERYIYDRTVYTLEVWVAEVNEAGQLKLRADIVVKNSDGTKAKDIEFRNGYRQPTDREPGETNPPATGVADDPLYNLGDNHVPLAYPSDPEDMVDPPVKKMVSGNPGSDGTFTFKLVAQDASSPMPEGSVDGVKTITIVGPGESEFGTWSYSAVGVYHYTVYEVNNGEAGYSYDTAVYTITDTVKSDGGWAAVSRIVTNDANKPVSVMTFINKYSGDGPKTGDDQSDTLYLILLGLGGLLVIGAVIYLLAGGKKRKQTD